MESPQNRRPFTAFYRVLLGFLPRNEPNQPAKGMGHIFNRYPPSRRSLKSRGPAIWLGVEFFSLIVEEIDNMP